MRNLFILKPSAGVSKNLFADTQPPVSMALSKSPKKNLLLKKTLLNNAHKASSGFNPDGGRASSTTHMSYGTNAKDKWMNQSNRSDVVQDTETNPMIGF